MVYRNRKCDWDDLLHSAHESRVAPRPRFLAGSGAGDSSRSLLGDEGMMGKRVTKDRNAKGGGGYKCSRVMRRSAMATS
jgi:hypothetical protein